MAAAVKNIRCADLDSELLLKDKLVKKGGTEVRNSMRIFPKRPRLGISELDQKLLGKPKRIYKYLLLVVLGV